MLTKQHLLELAELIHLAMRGRAPLNDEEVHQAEQAAVHIADWFTQRPNWIPRDVDTVTFTTDEIVVLSEQVVAARSLLADTLRALRDFTPTDAELRALAEPRSWKPDGRAVGE